jgi:hypothetical protein
VAFNLREMLQRGFQRFSIQARWSKLAMRFARILAIVGPNASGPQEKRPRQADAAKVFEI